MQTGQLNIDNTALMKKCLDTSIDKSIASIKNTFFKNGIDSFAESRTNLSANPHLWPEFSQVMDHLKTLINPEQIKFSWYTITLSGGEIICTWSTIFDPATIFDILETTSI